MFLSLCTDSEDNDIVIEEKMTVHVVSNATRFFVGVCMGMWTMCNDTLPKVKFKRPKEEDDDSHALFMTSVCEGCRRESWMKNLIYAPRPQEYAQLGICEKMTLSNNANQEATPMPRNHSLMVASCTVCHYSQPTPFLVPLLWPLWLHHDPILLINTVDTANFHVNFFNYTHTEKQLNI